MALNVFFRNSSSSVTDVVNLGAEDFHHRDTSKPIVITLTFTCLTAEAIDDLGLYYRQGQLTISAKAIWNEKTSYAEVRQFGQRMVMEDFSPYFKADEEGKKAAELKQIYDDIQKTYSELPNATTGPSRVAALRAYEESHPELCSLIESAHQFFGFTKGSNLLSKYIQWVYIPAVKEASTEQEEGSKTALGQLFQRSIRTKVSFKESIARLRNGLEKQYRELLDSEKSALDELSGNIQERLREWANPNANLQLSWYFDPNKTVVVQEPVARASLGEDNFIGEVARLGHGMQRAFLVALLHELAMGGGESGPTLILGMEEPELYQHPSQAMHIADVLQELSESVSTNSQVMISTHSPYFVSARGFENVRVVRKHSHDKCSLVASTSFVEYENAIASALGAKPDLPSVVMTSLEQIMQPSLREMYFSKFAVLVEGVEDVAFIATHLKVTNRWRDFRKYGCHFVVAIGKSNLSRPIVISQQLCIPYFAVFDTDGDDKSNRKGHERDNKCLFALLGFPDHPSFPKDIVFKDEFVCWPKCIFESVKSDFGESVWEAAEKQARKRRGYIDGVRQKNTMLITAVLEELSESGKVSSVLTTLCDRMLVRASSTQFVDRVLTQL